MIALRIDRRGRRERRAVHAQFACDPQFLKVQPVLYIHAIILQQQERLKHLEGIKFFVLFCPFFKTGLVADGWC